MLRHRAGVVHSLRHARCIALTPVKPVNPTYGQRHCSATNTASADSGAQFGHERAQCTGGDA